MNTQPRHPKCRALPVEPHPDIQFLPLYHGREENQRFLCLWSFLWSKPLLCCFRQSGKILQTQVSQGFAAFRLTLSRIQPRHSQTRRDTSFAIPGYSFFCHDTTASGKNKDFSVCGHLCGQNRFYAAFGNREKSRKRRCHEAFRRFALPRPGYSHGTPKASALPTALHPDTVFTLHRKSVFDSPNSILDFGRKVNRPVAYPARIAYNKNITQYIKERAL